MVTIPEVATKKQFMIDQLQKMEVGDSLTIDKTDVGRWAYGISAYIHPAGDKRFRMQTDKAFVPDGKALIWRTK